MRAVPATAVSRCSRCLEPVEVPVRATIDALYAIYDGVKINYPYGQVVFELSNIQMYLDNLSNVYNTYMPRIVFGMVDDPEAFVAEFRAQLKAAGINTIVLELAEKYKLPVIDLYGTSAEYGHLRSDGVHFQREGYEKLADVILSALKKGSI